MGSERGQGNVEWIAVIALVAISLGALARFAPSDEDHALAATLAHSVTCAAGDACPGTQVVGIRSEKRTESRPPRRGEAIAALAGGQHGGIARTQLFKLGLDRAAIRRRVVAGMLHPLHGGWVFAAGANHITRSGMYLAAVMACGSKAVLSHRSAADLWGIRSAATRLEVTVPRVSRRTPGIQVHRSRVLTPNDIAVKDGIPVTSVARTLLDLAAVLGPDDLEVAVDRAERLGLFDLTAVVDVLERARGRRGARALRRTVQAYETSTQKSRLERRFKALLETAADIPKPSFNALVDGEVKTHEVDAWWPAQRLAVQTDGFEFHRTRRDRERDAASDADLELAGHRVIRLTWDEATIHGERTLRRLRMALGRG
jgi:hypothetical protein